MFCVNLIRLKDIQIADKVLLVGMTVSVLESSAFYRAGLVKKLPPYECEEKPFNPPRT